jgi:hypothetical protein
MDFLEASHWAVREVTSLFFRRRHKNEGRDRGKVNFPTQADRGLEWATRQKKA